VLDDGFAGLEELVLGGEELVVDAVAVALLAPPLVRPDLPPLGQAFVPCNSNEKGAQFWRISCLIGYQIKSKFIRYC